MLVFAEERVPAATYRVLSCGVNVGPGAAALSFAEKDAVDVARVFTSGIGPVEDDDVTLLMGGRATFRAFDTALHHIELLDPDFLVVYFSGHGDEHGILLADGLYPHWRLARRLRRINPSSSIVILDSCSAASFQRVAGVELGGLLEGIRDEAWCVMLANATEGNRLMFSTGHGRTAGEGRLGRNGDFTHALLSAMRTSKSDLDEFISEKKVFTRASTVMRLALGRKQEPVAIGLTGDFPLAMSQASAPAGDAAIQSTRVADGKLMVKFALTGRKHLPTRLRWRVRNPVGQDVATDKLRVAPTRENDAYVATIALPTRALTSDQFTRLVLDVRGRIDFDVVLSLEDQFSRPLDSKIVNLFYRA